MTDAICCPTDVSPILSVIKGFLGFELQAAEIV